jgi:hypothetical protein
MQILEEKTLVFKTFSTEWITARWIKIIIDFFVRHCQNLRIFSCVNGF